MFKKTKNSMCIRLNCKTKILIKKWFNLYLFDQ